MIDVVLVIVLMLALVGSGYGIGCALGYALGYGPIDDKTDPDTSVSGPNPRTPD